VDIGVYTLFLLRLLEYFFTRARYLYIILVGNTCHLRLFFKNYYMYICILTMINRVYAIALPCYVMFVHIS